MMYRLWWGSQRRGSNLHSTRADTRRIPLRGFRCLHCTYTNQCLTGHRCRVCKKRISRHDDKRRATLQDVPEFAFDVLQLFVNAPLRGRCFSCGPNQSAKALQARCLNCGKGGISLTNWWDLDELLSRWRHESGSETVGANGLCLYLKSNIEYVIFPVIFLHASYISLLNSGQNITPSNMVVLLRQCYRRSLLPGNRSR